jgi:TonB-linked SusC/RagA family outer membrane protein
MRKKIHFLVVVLSLFNTIVVAQLRSISGVVSDENGKALVGATIQAKGATASAVSGVAGKFAIQVPGNVKSLVVSYVGMEAAEVILGKNTSINISLQSTVSTLSDVVVIGYGAVRKTDVTGSIQRLGREDLIREGPTNILQAMQGKIAGVNVTQNDGAPGAGISIRIRGSNSFLGGTEPLYVIDGVPFNNSHSGATPGSIGGDEKQTINAMAFINPADVESIDILKDASATAIYGSRGANINVGLSEISKKLRVLSPFEYAEYQNLSYKNANFYDGTNYTTPYSEQELDTLWTSTTNWQDAIFRRALSQQYTVNVSGGSESGSHSLSLNYINQDGAIINSDFRKMGLSFNLNRNIGKFLRMGTSTSISNSIMNGVKTGTDKSDAASAGVIRAALTFPSTIQREEEFDGTGEGFFITNPLIYSRDVLNRVTGVNIFSSNYAEISFLRNFKFRQNLGFNYGSNTRDQYYPRTVYEGFSVKGSALKADNLWTSLVSESILSFQQKFGKHSVSVTTGSTFERTNGGSVRAEAKTFPNDLLANENMQSAEQVLPVVTNRYQSTLISFLARATYSFGDRYLLSLAYRQDGSSKFGKDNKWAGFPSAGLAWKIHQESFLKKSTTISNLILRLSYGKTGNQGIGSYASLSKLAVYNYPFNGVVQTGLADDIFAGPANASLRWETTDAINAGLDLGLWKGKLNLRVDVYQKRTNDLLQFITTPASTGFQRQLRNSGSVENKGLEITLEGAVVKNTDFQWRSQFNISFNRNKILSLGGSVKEQFANNISTRDAPFIQAAGYPIGALYGYVEAGFYDNEAEVRNDLVYTNQPYNIIRRMVGEIKYRNLDNDPTSISISDRTFIGDVNPDFIFGFTNNFTYKKFDVSVLINGVYGNDIVNMNTMFNANLGGGKNVLKEVFDGAWAPGKDNSQATSPKAIRQFWRTLLFSDRFIEDGSFMRLKNVTIGYTLPNGLIKGISSIRLALSGNNLYTLTNYSGYDPEINSYGDNPALFGVDLGGYPNNKSYNFSIRCNF